MKWPHSAEENKVLLKQWLHRCFVNNGCLFFLIEYLPYNPFSCLSSSTVSLIALLVLLHFPVFFYIFCPFSSLTVSYSLVLETCSCKFPPFLCYIPLSLHLFSVFIKFISKYLMVRCVFPISWCETASCTTSSELALNNIICVLGQGCNFIVFLTKSGA